MNKKDDDYEVLITEKTMKALMSWTIKIFIVGMLCGMLVVSNLWMWSLT